MTNNAEECRLFGVLRSSLRHDLVSWHGFSNPDAGKILNWFDPADSEYLEHVEGWQVGLCQGACECPPPLPVYQPNMFGTYDIFNSSVDQIGAIHQVAKLVYKWHGVPRRETNMNEVKQRLRESLPVTLDEFELEAIRTILQRIEAPDLNSVIGRFGPGATFEGFRPDEKWARLGGIPDVPCNLFRCSPRDTKCFRPFGDGYTKIAEVPKSIKSNRIVSSEPAMYMYAQLGVADSLVDQMHRIFAGHISLDDAERHNQALLFDGACSIDLSDASDHVSVSLVQALLPQLWPVLAKVRSSYSIFPDGDTIRLATFAPMGSGVCFPILTLVVSGLCEYASRVIRKERHTRTWWRAYGDDIIVPICMYDFVVDLLTRAGLVVNTKKSCCTQVYRESCGREMFKDTDITPVYIRDPIPLMDASKVEQVASSLEKRFFPTTARTIADLAGAVKAVSYNRDLQRLEVLARVTTAKQKVTNLDGWDGLNRWFALRTQGKSWDEKLPPGIAKEVWTKPGWRYKASQDYPYLTTWFVTSGEISRITRRSNLRDQSRSRRNRVEWSHPKG